MKVPFNRAYQAGAELNYMATAMARESMAGDGHFTKRAAGLLREIVSADSVMLTTSCSHALDMTALLMDLQPGDEVIMPSFTFPSTANAYVMRGAIPVFVDSCPDTLNIDPALVEAAITDRTRAIVVVHYAGIACAMASILQIAHRHGIEVIEDNAHGLGGAYRGQSLGSFGAMATLSFHLTKNVHCGEGGALIVNRADLVERAEIVREKGTNRTQFLRGIIDKYQWVGLGSSYLPSEALSAFLTAQLEKFDTIQERRSGIWSAYHAELADWAGAAGVAQPTVPEDCAHPAHLYYLLFPSEQARRSFIAHLAERGVQASPHYQPLHSSPAGVRYGRTLEGGCPITDRAAERLVRLPLYPGLLRPQVDAVIEAVLSHQPHRTPTSGPSVLSRLPG